MSDRVREFTKNLIKEIEAADPVIEASRNIVLQDLRVQFFDVRRNYSL